MADGLVYPDGTFRSREDIQAKLASKETTVEFTTPVKHPPDSFDWWQHRVVSEQELRREALGLPEHVEIQIRTPYPIILGMIGDVHAGNPDADYELFYGDVAFLRDHPQAYALLFGDLTDSYFFTPAVHEHLMNLQEQYGYMRAACDELRGKILAAWGGNHDLWASRMGGTMYDGWTNRYNAHYLEGMAYLTIGLNENDYRIVGSHKHRGFSIWNHAHQSIRQALDDAENADLSITAHKHIKARGMQYTKIHGGEARPVHYVALGSYSPHSMYSRIQGWHTKARNQMGATFAVMFPGRKRIEIFDTREEAAERVAPYLRGRA